MTQSFIKDDEAHFSQFLGASVLSAVGSLPQHIAPLIVIVIIAEGRVSVSEAGWVLSARAFGELLTSIALPALGLVDLRRSISFAASASLLGAFALASAMNFAAVVLGFFIIGGSCGVLKYIGTIAVAGYQHRTFAFVFRLALVLGLAGVTICFLLLLTDAFSSYTMLLERLTAVLLPILMSSGLLYRPTGRQRVDFPDRVHGMP